MDQMEKQVWHVEGGNPQKCDPSWNVGEEGSKEHGKVSRKPGKAYRCIESETQ